MPRTWRALPVPGMEGLLLKAPTHQAFLDQEYDGEHFRVPRTLALEMDQALAMLHGLTNDPRVAPKRASSDTMELAYSKIFRVYRYNQGIGVDMPSGWVLYFPLFGVAKEEATKATTKAKTGRRKPTKEDEGAASGGMRATTH